MSDPENEATLQATANLSPVSPSPVHSVAVLAVPVLQQTVDTIEAMVVAASARPNGGVDVPEAPHHDHDMATAAEPMEELVDDDSFDDAYAEESQEPAAAVAAAPLEQDAMDSDDYAKTFDSPIEPQEEEAEEEQRAQKNLQDQHVPSRQRDPRNASLASPPSHSSPSSSSSTSSSSSEPLTSHAQDVPNLSPHASATIPQQPPAAVPTAFTQLVAHPDPAVPPPASSTPANDSLVAASASAPSQPMAEAEPMSLDSQQSSADIQQLVADLIANPMESSSAIPDPSSSPAKSPVPAQTSAASTSLPSTALPSPSSLPPRPPLPQANPHSYPAQHHPAGSNPKHPPGDGAPHAPGKPSSSLPGGPGVPTEAVGKLPSIPSQVSNSALNAPPHAPDANHHARYQRQWDQFMADERQYMADARWDRFPEGSRIFIGNLSSDKVSKRDVFEIFHKFGRLAQISLKSAYGFVQYHTVDEGHRALEKLQGIEVKGRRIHLEISRVQEKPKKERNRSSERTRGPRESGRRADKHNRDGNREDHRAPRNHSPRRKDHYGRNDSYSGGGERGVYYDSGRGRGRSRSPGYRRHERDYRRRSPSPYGARPRHDAELDIPRRYGSDIPDVQIIMQPDVSRDFATWAEGALKARGLKTAVMYLHPRIPKDQVIQRQAAEGVVAVVDLDLRSQSIGRISIHCFDRSGGMHNVRFEQYVDLEPGTAAEIILRAKAPPAVSYGQPYGGSGVAYPAHPYGAQPAPAAGYPAMQPQAGAYPPQQPPGPVAADIASLMGRVDNATLQQLLSTIQAAPQGMSTPHGTQPGYAQPGPKHAAPNLGGQQVDIQALLGSLNSNQGPQHPPPQAPYDGQYRGHAQGNSSGAPAGGGAGGGGGDAAAQVQNIMAQLARYRQ